MLKSNSQQPVFYSTNQDSRGRYMYNVFNSKKELLLFAVDEDYIQNKLIKISGGTITTPNDLIKI